MQIPGELNCCDLPVKFVFSFPKVQAWNIWFSWTDTNQMTSSSNMQDRTWATCSWNVNHNLTSIEGKHSFIRIPSVKIKRPSYVHQDTKRRTPEQPYNDTVIRVILHSYMWEPLRGWLQFTKRWRLYSYLPKRGCSPRMWLYDSGQSISNYFRIKDWHFKRRGKKLTLLFVLLCILQTRSLCFPCLCVRTLCFQRIKHMLWPISPICQVFPHARLWIPTLAEKTRISGKSVKKKLHFQMSIHWVSLNRCLDPLCTLTGGIHLICVTTHGTWVIAALGSLGVSGLWSAMFADLRFLCVDLARSEADPPGHAWARQHTSPALISLGRKHVQLGKFCG